MKYVIREKIFTLTNKFHIKDINGVNRYRVVGRFFTLGNKLNIYDEFGNNLIYIRQKIFRLLAEYHIYSNSKKLAVLKKNISILRPRITIDSIYGDLQIDGDILRHEFNIIRDNRSIARVSKRWISISDSYVVDIDQFENQEFILSLVIVLDQIFYNSKVRNNNKTVYNTGS